MMTDDYRGTDDGYSAQADIVDGPPHEPIELATLVPHFASPILDRPFVPARADEDLTVAMGPLLRTIAVLAAPAVVLAIAVLIVADVSSALWVGALGSAARTIRWIGNRVEFSFGDGFLSFRPDTGWPHGVQEDDDVHWQWSAAALPRRASAQADGRDLPGVER